MVAFKSLKITHLNAVTQIDTKRRFCHQNLKNTCKLEGIQIKLRQQIYPNLELAELEMGVLAELSHFFFY